MSAEEKTPRLKNGDVIIAAIRAGKTDPQAVEAVHNLIPDCNTRRASVQWYRKQLREAGESILTSREAAALQKAALAESTGPAGTRSSI